MFKQAFRFAFVAVIWKQYKRAILSTLILFAYLWLVGSLHEDYLSYEQDRQAIGWSFIYKWIALALGALTYLVFHLIWPRPAANKEHSSSKSSWLSKNTDSLKSQDKSKNNAQDPFDFIRNKKKLRSRAEMMIDKDSE